MSLSPQRAAQIAGGVDPDLGRRIEFLLELDGLKSVERRNRLIDGSRFENTAEHSWHLAMLAMVLAPYADPGVDMGRVLELVLVHDIVEIDAGDTFIYDTDTGSDKEERELAAAHRLFGLVPEEQALELMALWLEYEHRDTPEGRFAYALDRLQPLLLNFSEGGGSWIRHDIAASQVTEVNSPIEDGSELLWQVGRALIAEAVAEGTLKP